ncbi:MAG: hypothetical protein L0H53_05660 [Candidatus Nitrosocosmicus sp.]|nr:hypothetical protein [Candidatus Nitrosocosmicus sp.]
MMINFLTGNMMILNLLNLMFAGIVEKLLIQSVDTTRTSGVKLKVSEIDIQILLFIWCLGAALSAVALLIPIYYIFVIVGAVGWICVGLSSFLIILHIKK